MKKIILLAILSASGLIITAQGLTLKGTVSDSVSFISAPSILAILTSPTMTDTLKAETDMDGKFSFTNLNRGFYFLTLSGKNYTSKTIPVRLQDNKDEQYYLMPTVTVIKTVVVKTEADIVLKGDTIQYTADSFKTQANASAEDLVKKLPGMGTENGKVTAQGEEVKRVLVDGKPYFGDDPKAALKNLPSENVEKVQVFDGKSDKAKFTGFDDGESVKTINIITKPGMRNGLYGRAYAGYGTDNYYQTGISLSRTDSKGRFSVIGQSNNVNQQNFSLDDVLGLIGSSGSNMRGRPRGSNGAPMARPGSQLYNFYVDNQNGITTTNALGLNYAGVLSPKVSVSGSYFISSLDNRNEQRTNQTYFGDFTNSQVYDEQSTKNSSTITHRINGRLEYNIDTNNQLVYVPAFTFQDINSLTQLFGTTRILDTTINQTNNTTNALNKGLSLSNQLIFQHKFKQLGKTITLRGNANFRPADGETQLDARNYFFRNNSSDSNTINQLTDNEQQGTTYDADVSYTYLINPKNQLEIEGGYGYNINNSNRINYTFNAQTNEYSTLDTALSSKWDNVTQTAEAGLRIRHNESSDFIYSYGLGLQQTVLNNDQDFPYLSTSNNTFYAIIPKLFIRYKPSKFKRVFAFYRVRPNAPNVSQLQDVLNNSNPLSLTKGNPFLKQQTTHFLVSRYSNIKPFDNKSFFAFVLFQASNNYIGNRTTIAYEPTTIDGVNIPRGAQLTVPTNLSGYINSKINVSQGFKIEKIKSNLNTSLGINADRTPSLINNEKNINQNLGFNLSVNLTSNISEKLDFNIGASVSQLFVSNSLQQDLNYNYTAPGANGKVFWQFYKSWFVETEVNFTSYIGLNEGFNTNILLLNPAFGWRSKENIWELKLYAFDAFNQNQAISRSINQTYVEDVSSLVIQRYVMVQALYNIKRFAKKEGPVYQPKQDRDH